MPTLGRIVVDMLANTAEFKAGLDRAMEDVRGWSTSTQIEADKLSATIQRANQDTMLAFIKTDADFYSTIGSGDKVAGVGALAREFQALAWVAGIRLPGAFWKAARSIDLATAALKRFGNIPISPSILRDMSGIGKLGVAGGISVAAYGGAKLGSWLYDMAGLEEKISPARKTSEFISASRARFRENQKANEAIAEHNRIVIAAIEQERIWAAEAARGAEMRARSIEDVNNRLVAALTGPGQGGIEKIEDAISALSSVTDASSKWDRYVTKLEKARDALDEMAASGRYSQVWLAKARDELDLLAEKLSAAEQEDIGKGGLGWHGRDAGFKQVESFARLASVPGVSAAASGADRQIGKLDEIKSAIQDGFRALIDQPVLLESGG